MINISKFPFEVHLGSTPGRLWDWDDDDDVDLTADVMLWFRDNDMIAQFTDNCEGDEYQGVIRPSLWFQSASDAALFKLTWIGT